MRLKRYMAVVLGAGMLLASGCPVFGLLTDCFGGDTISEDAYDDLSIIEQLQYEENSCGRYDRVSGPLDLIP